MAKKITKKEKKILFYAFLVVLAILFFFCVVRLGSFGRFVNNFIRFIFGDFYLLYFTIGLLFIIKKYVLKNNKKIRFTILLSIILLCCAFLLENSIHYFIFNPGSSKIESDFLSYVLDSLTKLFDENTICYGGIIGTSIFSLLYSLLDKVGTIVICIALFVLSVFVVVPLDAYKSFGSFIASFIHKARLGIKSIIISSYSKSHNKPASTKKQNEEYTQINNGDEVVFQDSKGNTYNNDIFIPEEFEENNEEEDEEDNSQNEEIVEENEQEDIKETKEENDEQIESSPKPVKVNPFAGYKIPSLKLLESAVSFKSDLNQVNAAQKGKKLIEVLKTFGIKSTLLNTHIGPSVTKFEIKPDTTVNLNKIINLTDNIKMELAAKEIRIEAPIPGRNAVGIEVPNVENVSVKLSELLVNTPKNYIGNPLVFALGKDLMGQTVFCAINKMPHLLIGGATGSGKSVCINTIITSILMRTRPDEVKLVLIDPKKVEFTPYHDVPHLLWPVITDSKMASNLLVKVVTIMKDRFDLFSNVGVRDISSYNKKVEENNNSEENKMEKLPYIVVIIDELADLMLVAGKEVEASIQRLTQLARASGIHLIVATQRPSTDVITGLIKSNIPSRISFAVSSSIDSRTILDQTGAERLLGNGDMLYMPQGENAPVRLQGCFVSDSEIQSITKEVKKFKPQYDDTYYQLERIKDEYNTSNDNDGGDDSLYEEAVEFIRKTQKASTSFLQRKFGIGYNRAARIIDTL